MSIVAWIAAHKTANIKIVHIQNSVLQQIWMKATGYGHWKNMRNPTIKAIMIASAEVEYEGYCKWTRVQEIMEFAHKINAKRIGIANCIGLINEARIFAKILRANGFEPFAVICKVCWAV